LFTRARIVAEPRAFRELDLSRIAVMGAVLELAELAAGFLGAGRSVST